MKRAYILETLPENYTAKSLAPDIKQKLESYRKSKDEIFNEAPEIRPSPFEKHSITKTKEKLSPGNIVPTPKLEDGNAPTNQDGNFGLSKHEFDDIIESLPKNIRYRSRKLLPFLLQTNYGDLDLANLLYDLTNKKSKNIRTHNIAILESVIKQLDSNPYVDKNLYVQKFDLLPSTSISLSSSSNIHKPSLPERSYSESDKHRQHTSRREEFIRGSNKKVTPINWI